MRRVFYIALGATAGVLIARKLTQTAQRFTPEGMAEGLSQTGNRLADAVAAFTAEVRAGMAEREDELRAALGIDGDAVR